MTDALDALYAYNHMTGGRRPSACYAPMKPNDFAARRLAEAREEARLAEAREEARLRERQELYADNQTTGGRPPEKCFAPLRGGNRRADDF